MAHTHHIANLLNIKDKHIHLEDKVTEEKVKNVRCKIVYGKLTYQPEACLKCGVANQSTDDLMKHGFKQSTINLTHINFQPVLLKLKKQRFYCKHCGQTTTAQTSLVDAGCFIANPIKQTVVMELAETQSMTLIAKHLNISRYTVTQQLRQAGKALVPSKATLPAHLGIDEFKSVKQVEGAMSCILMDVHHHQLLDILPDRTQRHLHEYFLRYPIEVRRKVETITMDMYSPYYDFFQGLFPNAKINIDRFHLIQLLNRSLNQYRIECMKDIRYRRPRDYTKFKQQWKLLLKYREDLDFEKYETHRLYEGLITEKGMVNYLLNIHSRLGLVYRLIGNLKSAIRDRNVKAFATHLAQTKRYTLPKKVRTAMQTLESYLPAIKNTLTYTLSNGVIEGTNNKIKNIKRSGYGYRSFDHLRYRIFIAQNLTVKADKVIRPVTFVEEEKANKKAKEALKAA